MHAALPPHFLLLSPTPLSSSPPISRRSRTTTTLRVSSSATSLASSTTMYELLSVTERAGPDEIKAAFRKLARKLHPDTCRSSEGMEKEQLTQQFIRAREAYRVLSDPVLREDYDYRLRNGLVLSEIPTSRRNGFGDWESQLDGLVRRSSARECSSSSSSSSWGSRMRAAAAAARN